MTIDQQQSITCIPVCLAGSIQHAASSELSPQPSISDQLNFQTNRINKSINIYIWSHWKYCYHVQHAHQKMLSSPNNCATAFFFKNSLTESLTFISCLWFHVSVWWHNVLYTRGRQRPCIDGQASCTADYMINDLWSYFMRSEWKMAAKSEKLLASLCMHLIQAHVV